jgi:hypothetical protein
VRAAPVHDGYFVIESDYYEVHVSDKRVRWLSIFDLIKSGNSNFFHS